MVISPLNYKIDNGIAINNLSLKLDRPINHLWGPNGIGKTTLLKQVVKYCQQNKIDFAYMDQNYRSTWLWWKSIKKNLELAIQSKYTR
ncbi:hypothetical protein HC766_05190 [Candidatus Gracilibacteria bacterium]|nr:hypothetical protein [Candidatus Gracilibacteria bacterium]